MKTNRTYMTHSQVYEFRKYMESLSKEEVLALNHDDLVNKLGFRVSDAAIREYRSEKGYFRIEVNKNIKAMEELLEDQAKEIAKLKDNVSYLMDNEKALAAKLKQKGII